MSNITDDHQIAAVQSNYLIEAHFKQKYTVQELKTILLTVSKINNFDLKPGYAEICITAQEFADFIEISACNFYRDAKKIAESLTTKVISIETTGGWLVTSWFSSIEYKNGIIYANIDGKLLPYLINLKEKFTIINLSYVSQMTSSYAIKLYQLLVQYKNIGSRIIAINKLQSILGIKAQKSLQKYKHFKQKILEISQREINAKTDIAFDYDEIKQNRKVISLKFTITNKANNQITSSQQEQNTASTPPSNILSNQYSELCDNLQTLGFSDKELSSLILKFGIEKLQEKFKYFEFKKTEVKKPKQWILTALHKDFAVGDMNIELKKIEEKEKQLDLERKELLKQKNDEMLFEEEFTQWENSKTDTELVEIGKKIKKDIPILKSADKAKRGSGFLTFYFRNYVKKESSLEKS